MKIDTTQPGPDPLERIIDWVAWKFCQAFGIEYYWGKK